MTDLEIAAFVDARAAEDERAALEAGGATVIGSPGHWESAPGGDEWEACESPDGDEELLVALRLDLPRPPDVMGGYWGAVVSRTADDADGGWSAMPAFEHAARHDPARVLRDVAAVRERVRLLRIAWNAYRDSLGSREPFEAFARGDAAGRFAMALRMVALDAAIWRDHPGYQARWADPEWRPETGPGAAVA